MESTTGDHGGSDLDLHSGVSGDDGEFATNTGRADSSNESKPSLELTNNKPEQRQRSITPNNLRKHPSDFWEIDVSDSVKFVNSTPSPSCVHQQDQVLNQKPAQADEDHHSNMSNCDSRNESGNVERESQTYTARNSVEHSSMASPALDSSSENNHSNEIFPSEIDKDDNFSKCTGEHQTSSSYGNIPVSSMRKNEKSSDGERLYSSASSGQSGELAFNSGPATQYPLTQVMKHPTDSASPSSYRIPSHVFARQTTSPMEWSITSNESLFSIHTGNMSFSREMYLLGKNDEFDKSGNMSGPLTVTDASSEKSPSDHISNSTNVSPDESTTVTAKAEETTREVTRENTEMKPSRRSDASKQSFAFPILADVERNPSAKLNQDKQHKEVQTQAQAQTQTQTTEEPQNDVQEPKTPKAGFSNTRWFTRFCCCGSVSS